MQQAAGSLWNINSWHWEQKNYTQQVKQLISNSILKIELEENGIKLKHIKITNIEGEAEINIRKGKQIFCLDFSLQVEWLAETKTDEVLGSYEVVDITQDDMDFQIINIKSEKNDQLAQLAKKMIKDQMKKKYEKFLGKLVEDIISQEANQEKLIQDKINREKANELMQKAREENGKLKEQIFKEQQEKEKQMKQQFSQWNEKDQQPQQDQQQQSQHQAPQEQQEIQTQQQN